ncbi:general transcriptional corepressor trfA-like [Carassius auratus]|uniref:General transcriptional corepressor trfA-like n=1 Tax=Carassius auratus TaxID=7957 RepID=A0A6P6R3U0_CARAU|nr:general transcriptional corepressor trfA-like [Carassius auratus]XP_026140420.1 general transcriptional corepressor trfA-like [Carassius auratus]
MSLHTGTSVHPFPESDTASSTTEGAESSNGTAAQSHSQLSVKPFGSTTARFKIRSAKTLTTKDLRTKSFFFEGGKVEDSRQKSYPSKDLNKACTSTSFTHTNTDDKESCKTSSEDTRKDSTLSSSSEKGDVSTKKLNTQEDKSQAASDRSRGDELRRFYHTNKSKSLDWRAGHSNRTGTPSGTREFDNLMRRSDLESLESTGTNDKITSYTQENQPSGVSRRIQAFSVANQGNQNSDRKINPISGTTSVRMNRVNLVLEQANSGQSLPSRLKPRLSQGSIGEDSSLWQGQSSLDQTDNRKGSWAREQGSSNPEEITGNQTIMERIAKLYGADPNSDPHSKDSTRLKRSNTANSDKSFPKSMDMVDSTPSHRKYTTDHVFGTSLDHTDSQQGKPSYDTEKARTFPRGFSKTYFDRKQEPSTNRENRNDQRDSSSGLSFSGSSKPKRSTETSTVKKPQSLLPDDNEEPSRTLFTGSSKYCSQSLERTRSRMSASAQYSAHRNQPDSSSISSQGVKHLLTTSGAIKEETDNDKQPDKEITKRLDINENKYLGGLQDGIPQPKHLLASEGAAHNKIHKEEEKDDVFTGKTKGKIGESVLEKSRAPSSESVKNTISMFESLAQQSKSTPAILRTRRAFSVPEHPKHVALVKKSDSDKNLHFGNVVRDTESIRTHFFSKSDSNEEVDCTLDPSRTPHSNSTVKVKQTLQQQQETHKKSVELAPALKQMNESRTEQGINMRDEDERRNVNKKHTDEPDSTITGFSGFRDIGTIEEKARIPPISQQSNVKSLLKQKSINVKIVDNNDNENTPTNSPDRAPLTINMQKQSSPGAVTVNGTHPKVLPNHFLTSPPVQTIYSSLNNSNNNNTETRKDFTTITTSMARWSSDEEDDDEETDTEEDSDSGESSVTITSNMSQSERRSFSLSFVELCTYGGVDYKSSTDDEDLPSTRSASLSSDISAFSSVTLLSTDELDRLLDDVRGLGDDTLQKYEDVQVVVLHKEVGSGLGFTLAGGVDQNKPVTVHRVIPGGVAAHEGSIFEGAQVLSINGTALQNSTHWEALRTLRKAKGQGMAVIVLQSCHNRKEDTERPGITGSRVSVILNKSSSDLGFSLEGGVGSSSGDKPLTVQKIFRGGPVNDVFPGDELLEVQDQSLVGMMRLEAWNLIKKLPLGPVKLLLHRPQQPR